jgi:hypothetical protein
MSSKDSAATAVDTTWVKEFLQDDKQVDRQEEQIAHESNRRPISARLFE